MVEKSIPPEMLKKMTFEQFQKECKHLSEMDDNDIKENFKDDPRAPEIIKEEYKRLADTVTDDEFNRQQQEVIFDTLKTEGNNLFREEKYEESLAKYHEALDQIKKMNGMELKEIRETIILNIALVYVKMNEPKKAIEKCETVKVLVIK